MRAALHHDTSVFPPRTVSVPTLNPMKHRLVGFPPTRVTASSPILSSIASCNPRSHLSASRLFFPFPQHAVESVWLIGADAVFCAAFRVTNRVRPHLIPAALTPVH